MEKMRLEQGKVLEELGRNKAVLDAVDKEEQVKIMGLIDRRNDPCSICLEEISERVSPNNCDHYFCLSCL